MIVLGIETSCDETAVALYDAQRGVLSHHLHSQVAQHATYGGVVPELASRDHIRHVLPLIDACLRDAGVGTSAIGGVAYTAGPGLIGALLVGAAVAKGLAWTWGVPALGVHHMEGHLLAPLLETRPPRFPFLALLVSGGHTLLVHVERLGVYRILGESQDDAAGEAFDKAAMMLGLSYPGGPQLARLAEQGRARFQFPRPMTDRPGLAFSFSGLKTYTYHALQNTAQSQQDKADIAYAFQEAVAETFVIKCRRALQQTGLERLVIAGGVSANRRLRERLAALAQECSAELYCPRLEFCTDNGAMIAYVGALRLAAGQREDQALSVRARWPLDTLTPPP